MSPPWPGSMAYRGKRGCRTDMKLKAHTSNSSMKQRTLKTVSGCMLLKPGLGPYFLQEATPPLPTQCHQAGPSVQMAKPKGHILFKPPYSVTQTGLKLTSSYLSFLNSCDYRPEPSGKAKAPCLTMYASGSLTYFPSSIISDPSWEMHLELECLPFFQLFLCGLGLLFATMEGTLHLFASSSDPDFLTACLPVCRHQGCL